MRINQHKEIETMGYIVNGIDQRDLRLPCVNESDLVCRVDAILGGSATASHPYRHGIQYTLRDLILNDPRRPQFGDEWYDYLQPLYELTNNGGCTPDDVLRFLGLPLADGVTYNDVSV